MKKRPDFEWDAAKDELNQEKHGVSFALAQLLPFWIRSELFYPVIS